MIIITLGTKLEMSKEMEINWELWILNNFLETLRKSIHLWMARQEVSIIIISKIVEFQRNEGNSKWLPANIFFC